MNHKVDTEHRDYQRRKARWRTCRDAYEGQDAVKAAGTLYLPMLDIHREQGGADGYRAYLARALFYNATARTVDGLGGAVFQKAPEVRAPKHVEANLVDVTLSDVPFELLAMYAMRDVLTVGRYALLVDVADDGTPRMVSYAAEDVVNWRYAMVGGRRRLVMAVLREARDVVDAVDPYVTTPSCAYRVLSLEDGQYVTQTHEQDKAGNWEPVGAPRAPSRRAAPLDFIPLVGVGPTQLTLDVGKPPISDLVDVNISHYQDQAQLAHGRYYTALPQPWVSGVAPDSGGGAVRMGPSKLWVLEKGGQAGLLVFDGAGLSGYEKADVEKRRMMATLGARLLEEQPVGAETATAVAMRHAGEHATLRTIAGAVEQALTRALRIYAWWAPGSVDAVPDDVDANVELNKDYIGVKMSSQDITAWVGALQAEAVSYETFWAALARGDAARPGVTADEEREAIEARRPEDGLMPNVTSPGSEPGDEIVVPGNPWRVVVRAGKYLVVKSDSGKVVGTHDSEEAAMAQLRALHAAEADARPGRRAKAGAR